MILKDYMDARQLQNLQNSFTEFASFDAIVVDAEGARLTEGHDFQEEETDSFDIVVNGERLGAVVVSRSLDRRQSALHRCLVQ